MAFTKEVLDEILKDYSGAPDEFADPNGLLKRLTKVMMERAMEAELTQELGYERSRSGEKPTANRRNGRTTKKLRTDHGPMEIRVPRDCDRTFEPQIVPKHSREWWGFDERILSTYALGITTRADTGSPEGDLRRGRVPRAGQPRHR